MNGNALASNAISTSGSRVKRIQRALEKQPTRGVRVALLCKSPTCRVAEWEAKDVRPAETAFEIETALIDHAEEIGFLVVDFQLVWESDDGRPIISPNISWRRPTDDTSPLDNAQLDGGDRTSRLQDQRHQEANMRMWAQIHQNQIRTYVEQNAQLHEKLMTAYDLVDEIRAELVAAQEVAARLQRRIPEAEESNTQISPLQEKALAMLQQYLPLLIASQMAPANAQIAAPTTDKKTG